MLKPEQTELPYPGKAEKTEEDLSKAMGMSLQSYMKNETYSSG